LKTNDIALLKVADLAVLVRRNLQIGAQNQQKALVSRKTKRNFRVEGQPEKRQVVGYTGFRFSVLANQDPLTRLRRLTDW